MKQIILFFLAGVLCVESLLPTQKVHAEPHQLQGPDVLALNREAPAPRFRLAEPQQPFLLRSPAQPFSVDVSINSRGKVYLGDIPAFTKAHAGERVIGTSQEDQFVVFTVDPDLQLFVEKTMAKISASHAAIVVMEPASGKILAIADKSSSLKNAAQHAGYPAASLFKVVTSAAALERSSLRPTSVIKFRGGTYTLNKYNYSPNSKYDKRIMNLSDALGKSCNPVFGRVALNHLSKDILHEYAQSFGFNKDLAFDTPSPESSAQIPGNGYELSRTAAGFGKVFMSPIHSAAFMSAVANGGKLQRPHIVDRVLSKRGYLLYRSVPETIQQVVDERTARTLTKMLEATTISGTSKYAFYRKGKPFIPGMKVAGKTGTLSGTNPKGLNKWFVGTAPSQAPEVVVSVLTVNPRNSASRPSYLGRVILQKYFEKNRVNAIS